MAWVCLPVRVEDSNLWTLQNCTDVKPTQKCEEYYSNLVQL